MKIQRRTEDYTDLVLSLVHKLRNRAAWSKTDNDKYTAKFEQLGNLMSVTTSRIDDDGRAYPLQINIVGKGIYEIVPDAAYPYRKRKLREIYEAAAKRAKKSVFRDALDLLTMVEHNEHPNNE